MELYPENIELRSHWALQEKSDQKSNIVSIFKPEISVIINNKIVFLWSQQHTGFF